MPVLFVGHGSPMNAIEDNVWSQALRKLGSSLAVPTAILAVSAHWTTRGLRVTSQEHPSTIHDFGGFPQQLFDMNYPAPGSNDLAQRVVKALSGEQAVAVEEWGLDHGTWSVLVHLFPDPVIPVVQLSIDLGRSHSAQIDLGRKLASLRDEGVLILASGNVTHNLAHAMRAMATGDLRTPLWASQFDAATGKALEQRDDQQLIALADLPEGRMSHPSFDHWIPLLVAYGATGPEDKLSFPVEGFDLGSLSMRSVRWG